MHDCAIQGADAAHRPSRPTQYHTEYSYNAIDVLFSSTKGQPVVTESSRCVQQATLQWCGWMGGRWWKGVGCIFFGGEGGGAEESLVISCTSRLSANVRHPLCVVYIHRIGSALHTNKILLFIIRAPQKSANQSDEDNKAGWVARTSWVVKIFFFSF